MSPRYLRELLRKSGWKLAPMVEGVRVDSFEGLERTLVALAGEYTARPREVRRLVIEAKDHAKLAAARGQDPEVKAQREEMVRWMLVWLENPPVFEVWARLRAARITEARSSPPG